MRGIRRLSLVLVTFALFATACSSSDDPASDAGSTTPSSTTQADVDDRLPASAFRDALGPLGVSVVDDVGSASVEGLQLWSYQVENLVRELEEGSGYLGSDLDDLTSSPGGIPFSYLLAGWLTSAPTPAAETAKGLMGHQQWEQAPSLVFPTAVLTLFVADALQAGGAATATGASLGQIPQPNAVPAALAQTGVCSTLAGWFNRVLDFLFESLKVSVEDDGFLGWLGTIWNAAVDLARGIVEGLVETLIAPVVEAIAGALAIVGTLSMIASTLQPWNLDLEPSNASTRFAVGGEPNVQEQVVATADPGYDVEWPAAIEDCATVAGLTLPDPTRAEGSSISWREKGIPEFGSVTEVVTSLDADNMATVDWVTGREDSDDGDELEGTVSYTAFVELEQVEELRSMIVNLIIGEIPSGPLEGIVSALFTQLTDPILDALTDLVRIKGSTSITVAYHDNDEEPSTTTTAAASSSQCIVGTWAVNGGDAAAIYAYERLEFFSIQGDFSAGSLVLEVDEGGTFTYTFDQWTYGITHELVEDFIVDMYRTISGEVAGSWQIAGTLLDLSVGGYETTVAELSISEDIQISASDLPPAMAGQYVIPTSPTNFECQGDRLAIEWKDTLAVSWSRIG